MKRKLLSIICIMLCVSYCTACGQQANSSPNTPTDVALENSQENVESKTNEPSSQESEQNETTTQVSETDIIKETDPYSQVVTPVKADFSAEDYTYLLSDLKMDSRTLEWYVQPALGFNNALEKWDECSKASSSIDSLSSLYEVCFAEKDNISFGDQWMVEIAEDDSIDFLKDFLVTDTYDKETEAKVGIPIKRNVTLLSLEKKDIVETQYGDLQIMYLILKSTEYTWSVETEIVLMNINGCDVMFTYEYRPFIPENEEPIGYKGGLTEVFQLIFK